MIDHPIYLSEDHTGEPYISSDNECDPPETSEDDSDYIESDNECERPEYIGTSEDEIPLFCDSDYIESDNECERPEYIETGEDEIPLFCDEDTPANIEPGEKEPKTLADMLFSLRDIGEWRDEFLKREKKIRKVLNDIDNRGDRYYPLLPDVFNCFRYTPLEKVKVVIWGQDPYPKAWVQEDGSIKTRAQGYSFGVARDDKVPGSLKNIYKELEDNFPSFKNPGHGDLRWICRQGVLFINSALTYNPDDEKSHQNIWTRFTHIVINIINRRVENCIHVLWGKESQKLESSIASSQLFQAAHPSPLSAYRGFFGCRHFYKINITLDRQGKDQINWNEDHTLKPTFVERLKKKKEIPPEGTEKVSKSDGKTYVVKDGKWCEVKNKKR